MGAWSSNALQRLDCMKRYQDISLSNNGCWATCIITPYTKFLIFYMFNCFWKQNYFIYVPNNEKAYVLEDKHWFIPHSQYHVCWWPGNTRSQCFSGHDIHLTFLEHLISQPERLQENAVITNNIINHKCLLYSFQQYKTWVSRKRNMRHAI